MGVGLAWEDSKGKIWSGYCSIANTPIPVQKAMYDKLRSYSLSAHNVMFDAAATWRWALDLGMENTWLGWTFCTYALYRQLASEGHVGQQWGLEPAQHALLGWSTSNKDDVAEWLIAHGFTKRTNNELRADKAELWRVPASVLGPYCAADASSCYSLLTSVLLPAAQRFPELLDYHQAEFMTLTKLLCEQLFLGCVLNTEKLEAHYASLKDLAARSEAEFFSLPGVREAEDAMLAHIASQHKEKEPPRFRKDGVPSKAWDNWKAKLDKLVNERPININSTAQMGWLLYDWLGHPVSVMTDGADPKPAVNEKALVGLGEVGQKLLTYRSTETEIGFVETCREFHRNGILHIQLRNPGTLTGRLAGTGGLNVQQLPHSPGYLDCWEARPGHVWIDSDFNSLEMVVLAELSQDKALMYLYGPDSKPNDIYLFNGSHYPVIGNKIRETYDPYNPTPESIKLTKQVCHTERNMAKVATLGFGYGMGAPKLQSDFALQGINLTKTQAYAMVDAHWTLYAGVRDFEDRLKQEWADRGGWVYNGLRRPMPVAPNLEKDLVNRVVQSTGHDILMKLLRYIDKLRAERGVEFRPIITDFHDEIIFETPESQIEAASQLVRDAYALLNHELDGIIPLKGSLKICRTMAEVKAD
jgi:hypothetical protein